MVIYIYVCVCDYFDAQTPQSKLVARHLFPNRGKGLIVQQLLVCNPSKIIGGLESGFRVDGYSYKDLSDSFCITGDQRRTSSCQIRAHIFE